jgi:hypothetical protein
MMVDTTHTACTCRNQVAANHVRPDGTTYHIVEYNPNTGEEYACAERALVLICHKSSCNNMQCTGDQSGSLADAPFNVLRH